MRQNFDVLLGIGSDESETGSEVGSAFDEDGAGSHRKRRGEVKQEFYQQATEALDEIQRALGHTPRILLIEDDEDVRVLMRSMLKQVKGSNITESVDGEEAMWQLKNYAFDLALVNLQLPKIDGVKIIAWCRKNRPSLPTPIITGHDFDSPLLKEAMALNPTPTLFRKPFEIEDFCTLLSQFKVSTSYERPAT